MSTRNSFKARTLVSLKNFLIFVFRERSDSGLFRSLEMSDKRFPPLDHGGVASAFFILKILTD